MCLSWLSGAHNRRKLWLIRIKRESKLGRLARGEGHLEHANWDWPPHGPAKGVMDQERLVPTELRRRAWAQQGCRRRLRAHPVCTAEQTPSQCLSTLWPGPDSGGRGESGSALGP